MFDNNHTEILERSDIMNQLNRLIKLSRMNLLGAPTESDTEDLSAIMHEIATLMPDLSRKVVSVLDERDGLVTLAEIEKQIASSLNTSEILELVLDAIVRLTDAERCFLLLTDETGKTKVQKGRNWRKKNISEEELAISSSIIGQVIETGTPVLTTNAAEDPRFEMTESVVYHGLRSVMCVPLGSQNGIIGAIYADHRNYANQFNQAKMETLTRFANQAAIALHNAAIYEELEEAYDGTLIGWAKALELRDENTEGHTQRVTTITLKMARSLGIQGDDLVNIQRGAILHDIGKMAIPDAILLKPGKLTEEERQVMNQHPALAMQMISKISFLSGASEIPCSHHEKWDGSGYPRGLSGEDIPLAARIFALVDVWDALTSDRPYREALPKAEVIEYMQSQSGTHFDPELLKVFLSLVKAGEIE